MRNALTHIVSGKMCRRCINELYALKLQPPDCVYWPYAFICSRCGEESNVVINLTRSGRRKLWCKYESIFARIKARFQSPRD